jgi:hypothetical protein
MGATIDGDSTLGVGITSGGGVGVAGFGNAGRTPEASDGKSA